MKKLLFMLACSTGVLFAGCTAGRPDTVGLPDNRRDFPVKFVAHRGESVTAPENTVEAYRLAWKNGCAWGVETDIHMTKDGVLVCNHDLTTERTGGVKRAIADQTIAELKALDVGKWKGPEYTGCRIPTLREVLAETPPDGHVFVEIKKTGDGFAKAFQNAFDGSGIRKEQLTFISFEREELRRIRKILPENRTLLLLELPPKDGKPPMSAKEIVAILDREKFTGVDIGADADIPKEYFTAEYIKTIHDAGYEVHFWTVDDTANARLLVERGADSITTNRATAMGREWTKTEVPRN